MEARDGIIRKSLYQFIKQGYQASSLKDIETATGVTKGAFYYYFKSKKDILEAGVEIFLSLIEILERQYSSETETLREFIEQNIRHKEESARLTQEWFHNFIPEILFFQLLLEVELLFPKHREKIYRLLASRLIRWEEAIEKAKDRGEIKGDIDASTLAKNFMSLSSSMLNLEFESVDLEFVFSDMKQQFEQYYQLIKI